MSTTHGVRTSSVVCIALYGDLCKLNIYVFVALAKYIAVFQCKSTALAWRQERCISRGTL